jgi:hypothetical protein
MDRFASQIYYKTSISAISILTPVFQSLSIKAFGPDIPAFGRGASWKITLPSTSEETTERTWILTESTLLEMWCFSDQLKLSSFLTRTMAWYNFVDRASTAGPASASTNSKEHLVLDSIEGPTGIAYLHPVALWVG